MSVKFKKYPKWTKKRPKDDHWYWWKDKKESLPYCVFIIEGMFSVRNLETGEQELRDIMDPYWWSENPIKEPHHKLQIQSPMVDIKVSKRK